MNATRMFDLNMLMKWGVKKITKRGLLLDTGAGLVVDAAHLGTRPKKKVDDEGRKERC